jgi:hypothetical protein
MKICVYTFGFNGSCGGSTALFKLAELLIRCGVDCRVWAPGQPHNEFKVPVADYNWLHRCPVVIYPEVVVGNPLMRPQVVRWLLNKVGVIGGDKKSWGDGDIKVAYIPAFADPDSPILNVFELWPKHIYPSQGPRSGVCFTYRRAGRKELWPDACRGSGATEIGNSGPALVGPIFRSHAMFVSYVPSTFLSVQAALCGCDSYVVPDEGVDAEEWRRTHPLLEYGVAYGREKDEVARMKETRPLLLPYLVQKQEESLNQVKELIRRLK